MDAKTLYWNEVVVGSFEAAGERKLHRYAVMGGIIGPTVKKGTVRLATGGLIRSICVQHDTLTT